MNMAPLDWTIVVAVLGVMVAGVLLSRSHMRSVADFLAAGRTAAATSSASPRASRASAPSPSSASWR